MSRPEYVETVCGAAKHVGGMTHRCNVLKVHPLTRDTPHVCICEFSWPVTDAERRRAEREVASGE